MKRIVTIGFLYQLTKERAQKCIDDIYSGVFPSLHPYRVVRVSTPLHYTKDEGWSGYYEIEQQLPFLDWLFGL